MWRKLWIFGVTVLYGFGVFATTFSTDQHTVKAQVETPLPNCIGVVGDSLAAGTLVAQLPGVNFVVMQTAPLSAVIDRQLDATRYQEVPVYNFSLAAGNLADDGRRPYRESNAYDALLEQACDVVVMTAWNNDLNVRSKDETDGYVEDVRLLIEEIRAVNSGTRVLIWTHFWGAPQNFVEGFGGGITLNNFMAHREATLAACEVDGRIGELGNVQCVDLDALFEGEPIYNIVIGAMGRTYFNNLLYAPLSAQAQGDANFFFNNNPNGQAIGDGVHFTGTGKRALAATVIEFLDTPPDPVAPENMTPDSDATPSATATSLPAVG